MIPLRLFYSRNNALCDHMLFLGHFKITQFGNFLKGFSPIKQIKNVKKRKKMNVEK